MTCRYLVADVFDGLASLDAGSVDLVVSSPPFLALRSYLPADHPDKAKEIGSEATPGEYLDTMLDVLEACARVLAPHGSLVFELGDTYAGGGGEYHRYDSGYSGHNIYPVVKNAEHPAGGSKVGVGWPLDKSKVLIPQLFAIALAYGFNPLTGRQTEPWRVRNTVAWCRPNPPVGRDGDKFRPATSFLTVACKARDRYWDGDAVRVPSENARYQPTNGAKNAGDDRGDGKGEFGAHFNGRLVNPAGAPLLDWWEIPTHAYPGAHYATWAPALVMPLVKSMCPTKVCRVCGEPSRRIVGEPTYDRTDSDRVPARLTMRDGERPADGVNQHLRYDGANTSVTRRVDTLGWSSCDHDDWRPGLVLDPFAGSGTTLAVATGHGLDCIGIDLDERNADLARERVGMWLTIESLASEGAA